jgi:signal transduction histidine kinase
MTGALLIFSYFRKLTHEKQLRFEKELNEKIIKAQEDERQFLAQEIHDEIGQNFSLLKIEFSQLRKYKSLDLSDVSKHIDQISKTIEDSTTQLRNMASDLSPSILKNLGLFPAIRWLLNSFEQRTNIQVRAEIEEIEIDWEYSYKLHLYRIIQEFLTNSAKHSDCSEVLCKISKGASSDSLEIILRDDGRGFDVAAGNKENSGLGLSGMRSRANALGAQFILKSFPKEGTQINLTIKRDKI